MNYLEYKKLNNSNKDVINSSLIKCYRERESLWNVKLKNCNINKQYEYYQEISNLTGIDVAAVPKVWKCLTNSLSRYKLACKRKTSGSAGGKATKTFAWLREMAFLESVQENRVTISSDLESSESTSDNNVLLKVENQSFSESTASPIETTLPDSNTTLLNQPQPPITDIHFNAPPQCTDSPAPTSSFVDSPAPTSSFVDSPAHFPPPNSPFSQCLCFGPTSPFTDTSSPFTEPPPYSPTIMGISQTHTSLLMAAFTKELESFGDDRKRRIALRKIYDIVYEYVMDDLKSRS